MKTRLFTILIAGLLGVTLSSCGGPESTSAPTTAPALPTNTLIVSSPAPQFGVSVTEDLRIVSIDQGSAAGNDGLMVGDVIKAMDGTTVITNAQARQIALDAIFQQPPKTIIFTIVRDGEEMMVPVTPTPPNRGGSPENPLPTVTGVLPPATYF